jgi:deoxyribose-phosphate aldolase
MPTGAASEIKMPDYTYDDIAKMIDHSLLGPALTDDELAAGCRLAAQYRVASVCAKPYYVKPAAALLKGSGVKTGTTIGFPHGGHATAIKLAEARQALADGAGELDMVVNIGKVLSGDWDFVARDIQAVVDAAHPPAGRSPTAGEGPKGAIVKVIFENCYLKDAHKVRLCEICGQVGADFVKTSTGYGTSGATLDDVKLMRRHAPPAVAVKAAGGIRTLDALLEYRALGVTRIGATRTAEMLDECTKRLGG